MQTNTATTSEKHTHLIPEKEWLAKLEFGIMGDEGRSDQDMQSQYGLAEIRK